LGGRIDVRRETSTKADDGAFVLIDWIAGYRIEPTFERPSDDACERLFVFRVVGRLP